MSKARKIVVNEQEFAWSVGTPNDVKELKIWKNKQIVCRTAITAEQEITPSLVKKIIMRNDLTTI